MNEKEIRSIIADKLETTHGNKEFIRQVREGEQDDGPFMQGAFAIMEHINTRWMLVEIQDTSAHDG